VRTAQSVAPPAPAPRIVEPTEPKPQAEINCQIEYTVIAQNRFPRMPYEKRWKLAGELCIEEGKIAE
jgi:hypothetical protein